MKNVIYIATAFIVLAAGIFFLYKTEIMDFLKNESAYCYTGAFLADRPAKDDIEKFEKDYGKKPYLVMVFVDWGAFVDEAVLEGIYREGSRAVITWEPWEANENKAINYDGLLGGEYDGYINEFALQLKNIKNTVFLRFAHEMNGNWYPWSGIKIGKDRFISIYRYVKDIFDRVGATNVKWIFSVNWQDVPEEGNAFIQYYPGDQYVDYLGIDGYNWGNKEPWSRWMSFGEIFSSRYKDMTSKLKKPVIISEFSSSGSGGDKALWIREAMRQIKKMRNAKAFIIFNVDKEADWSFPIHEECGKEFKRQLEDIHFRDTETDP